MKASPQIVSTSSLPLTRKSKGSRELHKLKIETSVPPALAPKKEKKAERIDIRCTAEQKEDLRKAAAYQGLSLSDFALVAAIEVARTVIIDHNRMQLSEKDINLILEVLSEENPEPNQTSVDRIKKALSQTNYNYDKGYTN